ncbi:MAG: RNA methyltransferase [Chloroflexi bacterium]|nr:RNA methyltransferase [Chloroflexota bacterium]
MITSVRNPHVALARRLHRASVRQRDGLILLEGPRLVLEAAQAGILQTVMVADYPKPDVKLASDAAAEAGARVLTAAPHVLAAAADSASRQAIVAIGRRPQVADLDGTPLVLVIDGVQDPGNVGTLVRSGAAAGATLIARTPGSADPFGPKALRAGVGAHFRVPIRDSATPADLQPLSKDVAFYVAAADAERDYHGIDWTGPCGLVVGAETRGVSSAWRAACRGTVKVPMLRSVESLNAGAAAAVILFEAARQRAALPQS